MAGSDLVISVGANIAALERQMRAAARTSEKAADDIESRFKKVNPSISTTALTNALKGFAAAFTVDKLIRGLAEANAELVRVGDTAKRVGLDLQRFQELQFAGRQSGLSGKDFGAGLEGLSEKLNEARQKENDLSQLFDDNNLKLKNRKGEVIGINEALGKVAGLVQNAATEFDKIKIAEAVGLTRDWVPLLEQGAEAINRQAARAREAGAVIDADVIEKARTFERDWSAAVDRWSNLFKANLGGIIGLIDTVIGKASELLGYLGRYAEKTSALEDVGRNGFAGASRDSTTFAANEFRKKGVALPDSLAAREQYFQDLDRESSRLSAFQRTQTRREFDAEQRRLTGGRKTDTSSLFNKGGGGGGGKSDEEAAQDRLDRYIESLVRQRAVMEAEIATVGKSNAERKAAVEIAKAQVDLDKLSATEKANYIAKLTQEVTANEAVRASKERLEQAQKDLNEAQKYFGNAAVDALEDLIVNGAKAEDVLKRLIASLAKAALQAALLGEGPLAGIFGTKGVGGNVGGLFGLLFGIPKNAAGGYFSGRGTGRSDSNLSWVSNGEFIVNSEATKRNRALLEAINSGRLPAFADGGLVGRVPSIPAASRSTGGMQVVVNNTVSDQVQATPQRGNDGSIQIMIEAIKGDIANDLLTGRGAIPQAFGAVRAGRQLRG